MLLTMKSRQETEMVYQAHASQNCAKTTVWTCRLNKVGYLYYGKKELNIYRFVAYTLVLAIIIFGRALSLLCTHCMLSRKHASG